MNKQIVYFVIGIIIILISTPLAYELLNQPYTHRNLTGEYVPILNGFIHSLRIVGILIFSIGLVYLIKGKK